MPYGYMKYIYLAFCVAMFVAGLTLVASAVSNGSHSALIPAAIGFAFALPIGLFIANKISKNAKP